MLLAVGMVLLAANLRPAAAAIGPLLGRIQTDTGLSGFGAGVLTTLPVLCFGALAPLAPALTRRLGERTTVAVALVVLLFGLLVRLIPGLGFLFFGTAVARCRDRRRQRAAPGARSRQFPRSHRADDGHVHDGSDRLCGARRRRLSADRERVRRRLAPRPRRLGHPRRDRARGVGAPVVARAPGDGSGRGPGRRAPGRYYATPWPGR